MSDQWLCLIDGQKLGPLKFTRLQQLAETGRLKPDDYVRPASDEQWLVAKNIPNLIPAPPVTIDQAETGVPAPKRRNSGPLPVAQAIVEPAAAAAAIPRGKTVAVPPSGRTIAPPAIDGVPFLVSDPNPNHSGVGLLHARKKKNNAMPLMIGGVAVVGVLAVVLVLVLSGAISFSGAATPVANAETKKEAAPSVDDERSDEFDDEETNPTDVVAEASPAAKPALRRNTNSALATVKQFRDITNLQNIKFGPAKIAVTGLWLSASEKGDPYAAAAGSADNKAAKYLVVKVKIENAAGAAPMEYQGWGDEAVLFDEADQSIAPLPPGKSPERIARQRIEPGGSLIDTLVFQLSSHEFQTLRLVLPHATVGIKGGKSFGLELPRQALGRGFSTELANVADAAVKAKVAGGDGPGDIVDKNAAPMAQPKPAADKPKKADDDDFIKKLEAKAQALDKMEQKK